MRKFEFNSGSLCLDLVDTLANRNGDPVELLATPTELDQWFASPELWFSFEVRSVRTHLSAILALRACIYRLAIGVIEGLEDHPRDIALLNKWSRKMPMRPIVDHGVIAFGAAKMIDAALSTISADAIELMFGPRRARIRQCPECGMIFVDNSRPGLRRWCSSVTGCGNRAKVRKHRAVHQSN